VDRSVSSRDVTDAISAGGRTAHAMPDREACRRTLLELAEPGDIILIMGARDDTLSEFAASLVADLSDPTRN
jgi:UDP-N-acetylmuramate--alanine ligase